MIEKETRIKGCEFNSYPNKVCRISLTRKDTSLIRTLLE